METGNALNYEQMLSWRMEDTMKKTRRILSIILAAAMAAGLAGCSGGDSESGSGGNGAGNGSAGGGSQQTEAQADGKQEASAAAQAEGKTTISYWTTNRHDQEYMTKKIGEFNESSDSIYIDFQVYADNYSQMLDLAFSTDTAPDVFQVSDFPTYYAKGYMMSLNSFLDDAYKARFGEGAFVEGINSYDGEIYSLPYTASACRLFYNQDIFDRVGIAGPPETLEEMVADAKLITEQLSGEGIYGFAGNYKSALSAVSRSIDPIVQLSGGTRAGFDYREGRYDFSSYKPVLELFKEIYSTGVAFPGSESLDIDPLRTQFAAGNIGMYISVSHAEPGVYLSQFPTDINWNCAQLPSLTGEVKGKQTCWFGGNNLAINIKTAHPEEAWEVMEFLHSDEVMGEYYTLGLGTVMIPSAVEGAEPPETIAKMPDLAMNERDQNWPPLPLNVVVEGKDYATVAVECIFGMTDIDAAIEDLNTRYNAAYDKVVDGGQERIVYPNFDPLNQDTSK